MQRLIDMFFAHGRYAGVLAIAKLASLAIVAIMLKTMPQIAADFSVQSLVVGWTSYLLLLGFPMLVQHSAQRDGQVKQNLLLAISCSLIFSALSFFYVVFFNLSNIVLYGVIANGVAAILLSLVTPLCSTRVTASFHAIIIVGLQPLLLLLIYYLPLHSMASDGAQGFMALLGIGCVLLISIRPYWQDLKQFFALSASVLIGQGLYATNLVSAINVDTEINVITLWWVNQAANSIGFFAVALTPRLVNDTYDLERGSTGLVQAQIVYRICAFIFLALAIAVLVSPSLAVLFFGVSNILMSISKFATAPVISQKKAHLITLAMLASMGVYLAAYAKNGFDLNFSNAVTVVLFAASVSSATTAVLLRLSSKEVFLPKLLK